MDSNLEAKLQQAYELIRAGKKRRARTILLPILRANQEIADAWYLLGVALADPKKKIISFEEVLRLEPENQLAQKRIAKLRKVQQKKRLITTLTLGVWGITIVMSALFCGFIGVLLIPHQNVAAIAPPTVFLAQATATDIPVLATPSFTAIVEKVPATDVPDPETNTPLPTLPQPVASATPNPSPDSRLTAKYWREWPTVPTLSAKAQSILSAAAKNPNLDATSFSRVGDCQLTTGTFLGGYVTGSYPVPNGFAPTVSYFRTSFVTESITAANGLGVNSVLNPTFGLSAGHKECSSKETPLDCELRIRRPAVVLVAMGTNWVPHADASFEKYLRQVIDRILATGALPILATKADNIEQDWKINEAVARVAYDYDLPLVNVWASVQDLPNHGLEAPKNIYLTGDAWMRRNRVWLETLQLVQPVLEAK